jgi:hypothetical protein
VAVYQKTLSLLYVDDLLQQVKDAFIADYKHGSYSYSHFSSKFQTILRDCESKADVARRHAAQPKASAAAATAGKAAAARRAQHNGTASSGGVTPQQGSSAESSEDDEDDAAAAGPRGTSGDSSSGADDSSEEDNATAANGGIDHSKLKALGRRVAAGPGGRRVAAAAARRAVGDSADKKKTPQPSPVKKKKVCTAAKGMLCCRLPDGCSTMKNQVGCGNWGCTCSTVNCFFPYAFFTDILLFFSLWCPVCPFCICSSMLAVEETGVSQPAAHGAA